MGTGFRSSYNHLGKTERNIDLEILIFPTNIDNTIIVY